MLNSFTFTFLFLLICISYYCMSERACRDGFFPKCSSSEPQMPIQVISLPNCCFKIIRRNILLLNFLFMFVTFIVISNDMVYDFIDFFNFLK